MLFEVLLCLCGCLVSSFAIWIYYLLSHSSSSRDELPPMRRTDFGDTSIKVLNDNNFPNWDFTLRLALSRMRVQHAIDRPLAVGSSANQTALSKIVGSIDDRHLTLIRGVLSAYDAYEIIANEHSQDDPVKQAMIEHEIRQIGLENFDANNVNEYIHKLEKKIDQLRMAGATLTNERELCMYVDNLPKELVPFRANIYGQLRTTSKEALKRELIRYCAMINDGGDGDRGGGVHGKDNDRVLVAEQRPSRKDKETRTCFYCNKKGHIARFCFKKARDIEKCGYKDDRINPRLNEQSTSSNDHGINNIHNYALSTWILDSGASSHYTESNTNLANVANIEQFVSLANGQSCRVYCQGDLLLYSGARELNLRGVKFAPEFRVNLISVPKLTESGFEVLFNSNEAIVSRNGQIILRAKRIDNLYRFNSMDERALIACKPINWHSRLAHPGKQKLSILSEQYDLHNNDNSEKCATCVVSKLKQLPYKPSCSIASSPLELIHSDVCGPIHVTGYEGSRYFIVFIDDYSRYLNVQLLRYKSDAFNAFLEYKALMEKRIGKEIVTIRTDNGGEYTSNQFSQFLKKEGIAHQLSVPYCHPQNGVAERTIGKIQTMARSMLQESCLSLKYWPEAIRTAAYLTNRLPHQAINNQLPCKMLLNQDPEYDRLRIFGSAAYSWIPHEKRKKLEPTSEEMIFVGYSSDAKAYRLLNPNNNKIINQRNCEIWDGTFPCCTKEIGEDNAKCNCKSEDLKIIFQVANWQDQELDERNNDQAAKTENERNNDQAAKTENERNNDQAAKTENERNNDQAAKTEIERNNDQAAKTENDRNNDQAAKTENERNNDQAAKTENERNNDQAAKTENERNNDQAAKTENERNNDQAAKTEIERNNDQAAKTENDRNNDQAAKTENERNNDQAAKTENERNNDQAAKTENERNNDQTAKTENERNNDQAAKTENERNNDQAAKTENERNNDQAAKTENERNNDQAAKTENERNNDQAAKTEIEQNGEKVEIKRNDQDDDIILPRRSNRESKPVVRFTYNQLGEPTYLAKESDHSFPAHVIVPNNYWEAMNSPERNYWIEAMRDEILSLNAHEVYRVVPIQEAENRELITTRWVFDIKENAQGAIIRFKARLVARGFKQTKGVDYEDTFSPVVSMCAVRIMMVVASRRNMLVHQIDIKTAFLNGDLDTTIFVSPPNGFEEFGQVWKVNKALYGLKQAPKCWNAKMNAILADVGFVPIKSEQCLYIGQILGQTCFLLVWVDDMLLFANTEAQIAQIKSELSQRLEMRDLGEVNRFLGINFEKHDNKYTLSQEMYINELLSRFGMENGLRITKLPPVDSLNLAGEPFEQPHLARKLIGSLLHIANATRPDIAAPVNFLARHFQAPSKLVWKYSKHVLAYLKHTKEYKLTLGKLDDSDLNCYSDANYATRGDRKAQSGAILQLSGSTIGWQSKKQKTVSLSSTEAEYVALAAACKEVLWLQQVLHELGEQIQLPTVIHEDNQPAIAIANSQRNLAETKHIDVKLHFIRDYCAKQYIKIQYVNTAEQLADCLTKVTNNAVNTHRILFGPDFSGAGGVS